MDRLETVKGSIMRKILVGLVVLGFVAGCTSTSEPRQESDDTETTIDEDRYPDHPDGESFEVPVGGLTAIPGYQFSYYYCGREKRDELLARGYQAGGPTWAAIIYGLMALNAPELVSRVQFDPEGDCNYMRSPDVETLKQVADLIASALESEEMLEEAIDHAESLGMME